MPLIRRSKLALAVVSVLAFAATPLHAMILHITYDASTATAPADFFTAFDYAARFYENTFHDPITINMQVGWGLINGQPLDPGSRAQSAAFKLPYTFTQIRTALINDAKSSADAISIAELPVVDPTGGAQFVMARAQAKALGLLDGNDTNKHPTTGISRPDSYVAFTSTTSYTFDPNNRAVPGKYDFIGMAGHEITESIARFGQGQTGVAGWCAPLDLFRYLSPGVLDVHLASSGAYFSLDGGDTALNYFNSSGVGDVCDWAVSTYDSYNYTSTVGQMHGTSAGDLTEMDVLGFDAVPEPATLSLLVVGMTAMLLWQRRRLWQTIRG